MIKAELENYMFVAKKKADLKKYLLTATEGEKEALLAAKYSHYTDRPRSKDGFERLGITAARQATKQQEQ